MKSLKEQVADLEVSAPTDFDPEEEQVFGRPQGDESSNDEVVENRGGREHYEEVSKSRLRQPEQPQLGKQYSGAAISRDALANQDDGLDVEGEHPLSRKKQSISGDEGIAYDEDEADLEPSDFQEDEEIDSEEAFGTGDEERFKDFKFAGSKDRVSQGQKEHDIKNTKDDEEAGGDHNVQPSFATTEDVDMESADSRSEDVSDTGEDSEDDGDLDSATSSEIQSRHSDPTSNRDKLKALLANDAAAAAFSLSAAANADVKKGKAVKQQYQTFDRLLDVRIKLQKGLTAAQDLESLSDLDDKVTAAMKRTEEAALTLFSTIESLRHSIQDIQQPTIKKRKHNPPVTSEIPSLELWKRVQSLESLGITHRRTTLDKWSSKTRATNLPTAPKSQLLDRNHTIDQNSITAVLDSQLIADAEKLLPPATESNDTKLGLPVYNDTSFYQYLLRDLISFRSMLNPTASSMISSEPLPTKLHQSGSRTKKVDTKASKGRKVRYTVHEKLQNFCAEEDRSTWSESARREFFASLLGGQGILREDVEGDDDLVTTGGKEEEALRFFRSWP